MLNTAMNANIQGILKPDQIPEKNPEKSKLMSWTCYPRKHCSLKNICLFELPWEFCWCSWLWSLGNVLWMEKKYSSNRHILPLVINGCKYETPFTELITKAFFDVTFCNSLFPTGGDLQTPVLSAVSQTRHQFRMSLSFVKQGRGEKK